MPQGSSLSSSEKLHVRVHQASSVAMRTAKTSLTLQQHCLSIQDVQGLLKTSDLFLPAPLALAERLRLGNADIVQFAKVLHNRIELFLRGAAVRLRLSHRLVKTLEFLGLAFF